MSSRHLLEAVHMEMIDMPGSRFFMTAAVATGVAAVLFVLGAANILFADAGIFVESAAFTLGLVGVMLAGIHALRHFNDVPQRMTRRM